MGITINDRARQLRRAATPAERRLWARLRNRGLSGHKIVRQAPIGPFVVDFVCRESRLVIEIDGATHATTAERLHDGRRSLWLEQQGYRVVRFTNAEVFDHLEDVLETIWLALEGRWP